MSAPEPAARALGVEVVGSRRVGGGDINDAWRLELADGRAAFLKSRRGARAGEYELEAAGLAWLAEPGGVAVPEVIAVVEDAEHPGLVLEWVEPGAADGGAEAELGRGLALTHTAGAKRFGAMPPGAPRVGLRFGGVEVVDGPDDPDAPWSAHYAARLDALRREALDAARVDASCGRAIDAVIANLDELAGPPEPPARIHGDLWSGNVHPAADGTIRLIDPAAHGAHRELDLAMLELFGRIPPAMLHAYEEVEPLADGWRERVALWQIQPLLVHAILFGGSYGAAAERAARRYV
ncbi:phosphotransferase [Thermoleophilia bacterium SCSIO 60948]|nr:phosphotransferase [Thermoleophilia bacterium SCSIO 60948]